MHIWLFCSNFSALLIPFGRHSAAFVWLSADRFVRLNSIIPSMPPIKSTSLFLSEKAAAQAVPAIGAAGGAIINTLFIDHFQDMARGHFIIRRLERKYGKEIVEHTYKAV
jgi:hypothetical protein